MEPLSWITLIVLTMFLLEGFVLSVFPEQFRSLMAEADPRALQAAGVVETIVAVGLIVAALWR